MRDMPRIQAPHTAPVIVIVGMGRSGTTWLTKLFDSHPQTLCRNEPEKACRLVGIPSVVLPHEYSEVRESLQSYGRQLRGIRHSNVAGSIPVFRKHDESQWAFQCRRTVVGLARCASRLVGEMQLPSRFDRSHDTQLRVVWKSVHSVGRVGAMAHALQPVRTILLVRHPCGVLASRLRGQSRGDFKPVTRTSWKYREIERLLDSPYAQNLDVDADDLRRLSQLELQALRWALLNQKIMCELEGRADARVIRYEDLCQWPETVCRDLFRFAGLSWHSQTEGFIAASTSTHRSRYYSVYKDPRRVMDAWREVLSAAQQKNIANLVGESRPGRLFYGDPHSSAETFEQATGMQHVVSPHK